MESENSSSHSKLILRWTTLAAIGRSKIVLSSYFWAVFVPIVAKALSAIPLDYPLHIEILKNSIVLGVPFTWQTLYLAAVFFAMGTAWFTVQSPDIIRRYARYSDFIAEGLTGRQLIEVALGTTADRAKTVSKYRLAEPQLRQLAGLFSNQRGLQDGQLNEGATIQTELAKQNVHIEPVSQEGAFAFIRDCLDYQSPMARFTVTVCYGIGALLSAAVLIENFRSVFPLSMH